jgi:predicted RND superfamily exporter protein
MLFIRLGVLLAIGMLAGAFFTLGLLPVLLVQLERQNRKKSRGTY